MTVAAQMSKAVAQPLHSVAAATTVALVCVQAYRIAVGFELIVLATAFVCFRLDRTELRLSASSRSPGRFRPGSRSSATRR